MLLLGLRRPIWNAVQDCPAIRLNWFNSKPWGIIIADNWSTKLSCKRWRTNLPAGPYRWLGAVSFSLVLEEDWLGFHVFDFSAFRLFDFSAFRSNHVRSTLIRYTHDICIQFFGISRDLNLNFWKYVAVSKVSKWKEVRQSWTNGLGFWKSPITYP